MAQSSSLVVLLLAVLAVAALADDAVVEHNRGWDHHGDGEWHHHEITTQKLTLFFIGGPFKKAGGVEATVSPAFTGPYSFAMDVACKSTDATAIGGYLEAGTAFEYDDGLRRRRATVTNGVATFVFDLGAATCVSTAGTITGAGLSFASEITARKDGSTTYVMNIVGGTGGYSNVVGGTATFTSTATLTSVELSLRVVKA